MNKEYVILDIETTGLSKHQDKITEIAAVKIKNRQVVDFYETLVNPERHIPSFITKLTGISDEMVEDARTIDIVLPEFLEFLGDCPIVAHNASFDFNFIDHNVDKHLNSRLCNDSICTRKLANRLLWHLPSKKLSRLCDHFEIINEQAHRAMPDAKVTTKVFLNFMNILEEQGFETKDDILNIQRLSPKKFRRIHQMCPTNVNKDL